jgi:23S rRNA (cytosine1962-C5)-methyltransferase
MNFQNSSVFCAHKPSGISSHQTDPEKPGFVEWLTQQKQTPVYLCHRLDKQTTGCFIATTDRNECAQVSELWAQGLVQKTYWFLTDKRPQETTWTATSHIEKKGSHWTSDPHSKAPNATTQFKLLKSSEDFFLIEARPLTGKTHQIRLQAQDSKVPLLGDIQYGGSPFPLFFLHCLDIQFADVHFHSAAPLVYENLVFLKNPLLCQWLISFDRRQRLYPQLLKDNQCLRLIHDEGSPLRVDLLGSTAHAGWWSDLPPTSQQIDTLNIFFETIGVSSWSLQNYGKTRELENKFFVDRAPEKWIASENGILYHFAKTVGAAPGLFLDQREHRLWVQKNSTHKRVLNLFAYTGGFSINAAHGGATDVVTVDLSSKYKKWAQDNFALNQLSSPLFKFYDMDSFEYLKFAQKKGLTYDLIICDPPSFSRNKGHRFQVDKDFPHLIELCLAVLSTKGILLFSSNYEGWSFSQWSQKLKKLNFSQVDEITGNFSLQWDFDWHAESSILKAFILRKK